MNNLHLVTLEQDILKGRALVKSEVGKLFTMFHTTACHQGSIFSKNIVKNIQPWQDPVPKCLLVHDVNEAKRRI